MPQLTIEQRYTIEVLLSKGHKDNYIGEVLGKDKSVISREISRNKNELNGKYTAELAQSKREARKKRQAPKKKLTSKMLVEIENLLKEEYSPEQVVGVFRRAEKACVSHETIYQHIWKDKKEGGTLYIHLRRKGKKYRKRGSLKDSRGVLKNRIDIDERPAIVEEKKRFGDLEIDTIIGKNHKGAIVTINDRASGYLWMGKVERRTAANIKRMTIALLSNFKGKIKTITADNGKEFALHEEIAKALEVDFYFAKPYHSWQRGANENLNGLVRQYIPKKTDFSTFDHILVWHVQNKLNDRPRKRFNFDSPAQVLNNFLNPHKVAFGT